MKPRNEKSALFADRLVRKVRYNAAVNHCRTVQNRAFANYQYGLRIKLQDMRKDDKQFWKIAREIGGIEQSRSSSAPSVEKLATHFASKMSNGKDCDDADFKPRVSQRFL